MSQKLVKSLSYAWPYTLPILAGYVFFGFTYGILMKTGGFPVWYATLTSIVIYRFFGIFDGSNPAVRIQPSFCFCDCDFGWGQAYFLWDFYALKV